MVLFGLNIVPVNMFVSCRKIEYNVEDKVQVLKQFTHTEILIGSVH